MNYKPPSPKDLLALATHGISVFTTLSIQNHKGLGLSRHLQRLHKDSLWMFQNTLSERYIRESIFSYLDQNQLTKTILRLTLFPTQFSLESPHLPTLPQLLITHRPLPQKTDTMPPLSLCIQNTSRPYAEHKSGNLITGVKARAKAKKGGFDDALFVYNNLVLEGPTWNIMFQKGYDIFTPSPNPFLLKGVTLQLIKKNLHPSFTWHEKDISFPEISQFTHAFITNSVLGAVPIKNITDPEGKTSSFTIASSEGIKPLFSPLEIDWEEVA